MKTINAAAFSKCIESAYENLNKNRDIVNELNVFPVPDGDTGTNMSMTIASAVKKIQSGNFTTVSEVAKALGQGSLMGARGNSGVILSQLCRGISKSLKDKEYIGVKEIRDSFVAAKETAYKAVMKPTEGTILTICRKMAECAVNEYNEDISIDEYLYRIYLEGKKALESTPKLLPVLKEANVVDAGGSGLIYLIEGALKSLNENIEDEFVHLNEKIVEQFEPTDNAFILEIKSKNSIDTDKFEQFDTEIISQDDSNNTLILKSHNPMYILNYLLKNNEDFTFELKPVQEEMKNKKEIGFVVVSKGDGFDEVFKSLNVDEIISGGQTMNPSTEDIYNACEAINAKNIFILPNNKNIIMASKQVKDLSDKNIFVLETKSIPEGFAALLSFSDTLNAKENYEAMKEAFEEIQVLEITYSIRDTKIKDLEIKKDDVIGLINGDIKISGKEIEDVLIRTVKEAFNEDISLITLYYGDSVTEKDAQKAKELLEKELDEIEVEIVYGGQPLYYYSISME